jgi:hypothetical protein
MVETKKKKLGLYITSSEKAERDRYHRFKLNSIPYPGCEFFRVSAALLAAAAAAAPRAHSPPARRATRTTRTMGASSSSTGSRAS